MFVLIVYNKKAKLIQSKYDTKSEKVGHRQILNFFLSSKYFDKQIKHYYSSVTLISVQIR